MSSPKLNIPELPESFSSKEEKEGFMDSCRTTLDELRKREKVLRGKLVTIEAQKEGLARDLLEAGRMRIKAVKSR